MFSVNLERWEWRFLAPLAVLIWFAISSGLGADVWYHLAWGRDIITAGVLKPLAPPLIAQPVPVNTYWLFQGAIYVLFSLGGPPLIRGAFAGAWIAIAALTVRSARLRTLPTLGPWIAWLMLILVQTRFEPRPEVLSYLCLSVMIPLAAARKWPAIFALQVVWSNVHGYFVLGPFLFSILFLTGNLRAAIPLALTLLASFVSPFGWNNWRTVEMYQRVAGHLRSMIPELWGAPLAFNSPTLVAFWIFVGVTLILISREIIARRGAYTVVLALNGILFSLASVRNLPLTVILAAPLWSSLRETPYLASWRIKSLVASALAAVAAVTLAREKTPDVYPTEAVAYLRSIAFKGRIFSRPNDGSYLEWALPEARVYGDSYYSDVALTEAYFNALRGAHDFQGLDDQFHFDALVVDRAARSFAPLGGDFGLAHTSARYDLYLRDFHGPVSTIER